MDTAENKQAVEIADCGYDCKALDSWRYGIMLDPESRSVSHWEHYGSGTPESVWCNRAVIADLPRGAVGELVEEILRGDEFCDLVVALFGLYEGSRWDGSNHVGQWYARDEYCTRVHDTVEAIEALFRDVATYWDAGEWYYTGNTDQKEADRLRERIAGGETVEDIASDLVCGASINGAWVDQGDLERVIENFLRECPPLVDDDDDDDEE